MPARGKIGDLDQAVSELQEVGGNWPDPLTELADTSLGLAEASVPSLALRYQAEAELAGAKPTRHKSGSGIEAGGKRAGVTR